MLRLASSKIVRNADRAINASSRILSGSLSNAFIAANSSIQNPNFIYSHNFCTDHDAMKEVDRRFVQVLKSKIISAKLDCSMPAIPADFAFPLDYTYYDHSVREIFMTREFDGEQIHLCVSMYSGIPIPQKHSSDGDDDINNNDCSDGDTSSTNSNSMPLKLSVSVSKLRNKDGSLEFEISASADSFTIDSIMWMDPATKFGPYEVDVESDLQNALREFLEVRGIKKSDYGFLHQYGLWKIKKYEVLKKMKMKKFIE